MSIKQKIIIGVCSLQLLLFVAAQAPFVDLTSLDRVTAAHQMSFTFATLKKIKDWRDNQDLLFNKLANPYFAVTQLGYPAYFFFLGAPTTSVFYSFEFTDKAGAPLRKEPFFTTCPLPWNECLAGKPFSDNLRLPLFELILIGQESARKPFPAYFLLERGRAVLESTHSDQFISFVAYEQPVRPWFEAPTEPLKRRVIHVAN